MSTSARPGFRPEIQALRAVAVTLVVVYHLWPDALPGGYVGVDVFFVISGFLITGGLWSEVKRAGRIGLAGFWARRIRRLLPAASVVLVASLVLALLFVPRPLWQPTVVQIGASALYVQNWVLAAGSIDYLAAEEAPTLVQHFWSLSVEEQFYLVWPLVMLLAVVVSRRRAVVLAAFGMLALASFVYSLSLTGVPSGYFDTAGRAWEFAAGGLLAFAPALRGRLAPFASLVGVALIGASAVLYNGTTVFPGAAALLPVLGALLVIAGGTSGIVARVSHLAPVRFAGDQSYALYLWHWPLLVCLPYVTGMPVDGWWSVVVLALTVLLGWLTTRFVERPIRRSSTAGVRRPYLLAGAGIAVIVLASSVTWSVVQAGIAASAETSAERSTVDPCFGAGAMVNHCDRPFAVTTAVDTAFAAQDRGALGLKCNAPGVEVVTCEFGDLTDPERTVAVVGNSHAAALIAGLDSFGQTHQWKVVLMRKTDCLGVSTLDTGGAGGQSCLDWTAAVVDRLEKDPEIDVVLFASHANALHYLADRSDSALQHALGAEISSNFAAVRDAGKEVVVVGDTPGTRPVAAPECVYLHRDEYDPCATGRSSDQLEDGNVEMVAATSTAGIRTLSLLPYVCGPALCHSVIGGVLVYFDDHHLTASFSRSLAPYLGAAVEAAVASK